MSYTDKPKIGFNPKDAGKHHTAETVAINTCPACHRPTFVTRTTSKLPPHDKLGCFWDACKHGRDQ